MIEDLTENIQIQIAEPYLLYRNLNQEILGIWFYNSNEREKVIQTVQRIIKGEDPSLTQNGSIPQPTNQPLNSVQQLFADSVPHRSGTLTKPQLKSALLNLIENDNFVDKVYNTYINSLQ
eukprot:TRINITY_DN9767_c0_g1_i1.p1 TRINITY_DN9767_c0_g1~~TRINITY_DN9767_c0_g1_i1.p1  ORF type:complete len:120 (+),score=9.52 TRINITY_DN9767_c0_g1_i1:336-695(+)